MRKALSLGIILFFFSVFTASAQRMLTLEEAIATALQNNYDIRLSRNDSMIAALDYSYRNMLFLPTVNGSVGNVYNRNNQQLKFTKRDGSGGDSTVTRDAVKTHNLNYSANLNWVLFDGLRMFATRAKAEQLVELGSLTVKNQVINTVADVVNTYYNIVRQKQQLKAVEEQIGLNEERVRLSQYKLDIGTGAKPDLLQSKVDLNAQKAAKLTQETLIEGLKERLNQSMSTQLGTAFEVSDSIPLNMNLGLGDIQIDIEKTSPTLLLAQKNIDVAKYTLKERKADLWPVISFNSAYNFTQNDNSVAVNINQPFYNQNKGFNYGFGASIPIFNGLNARRLIKQAKLDINFLSLSYESQRSILNLNVVNAFKVYESQKKALRLEEENILLARENVDIVFQTYRLGAATLVQLREAQNSLEDANNRLIAARYALKLSEIELLRLKGEIVR